VQRISWVDFIITLEGVEMELKCVRTIMEWPELESHSNIQFFLSFTNFYHCFICTFSKIAKQMIDMLKRGKNRRFMGPFVPTWVMKQLF
jgi:hypothetical protein